MGRPDLFAKAGREAAFAFAKRSGWPSFPRLARDLGLECFFVLVRVLFSIFLFALYFFVVFFGASARTMSRFAQKLQKKLQKNIALTRHRKKSQGLRPLARLPPLRGDFLWGSSF